ncbi:hypothetical protein [Streptococcus alactolyticus]|uniref:hypothetical protein n=1 Tax=Streptococcus alactolyticus TaxID=29389 RepID=UPI003D01C90D
MVAKQTNGTFFLKKIQEENVDLSAFFFISDILSELHGFGDEGGREQGQNEARQQWHDDQVEWGIQQGYLNPDGSPKETN